MPETNQPRSKLRNAAIYVVNGARVFFCSVLWILLCLTLILLLLHFPHPPHVDEWLFFLLLHKGADVVLAPIDSFLQWENAVAFYLVAFGFLCSSVLIVLDSNLLWLRRRLERS